VREAKQRRAERRFRLEGSQGQAALAGLEQTVELRYPNGRSHVCSVVLEHELNPGAEFELLGRVWRVQGMPPWRRGHLVPPRRLLCIAVSDSPLAKPAQPAAA
jgi:hypothetical protein